MTPPDFSRTISVSQHGNGSGGIWLMLLFSMPSMAAVVVPGMSLLEQANGILFVVGLSVVGILTLIAALLGVGVSMWLEGLWRRWRGLAPLFSETAQVDINAGGFSIKGLGEVAWRDVLALEGIPDSESALIVHTRTFEKVMLEAPTEELAAVLSHYMELQARNRDAR